MFCWTLSQENDGGTGAGIANYGKVNVKGEAFFEDLRTDDTNEVMSLVARSQYSVKSLLSSFFVQETLTERIMAERSHVSLRVRLGIRMNACPRQTSKIVMERPISWS